MSHLIKIYTVCKFSYFHVNAIDLHISGHFPQPNKSGMPIFLVYYHNNDLSMGVSKLIFHINTGKVLFYYNIKEMFTTINLLIRNNIIFPTAYGQTQY